MKAPGIQNRLNSADVVFLNDNYNFSHFSNTTCICVCVICFTYILYIYIIIYIARTHTQAWHAHTWKPENTQGWLSPASLWFWGLYSSGLTARTLTCWAILSTPYSYVLIFHYICPTKFFPVSLYSEHPDRLWLSPAVTNVSPSTEKRT